MLRHIVLLILVLIPASAFAQLRWQEGRQYSALRPAVPVSVPAGKIEVTEVFSYGCIACNQARLEMDKLKASLPADAVMTFVHASFRPDEAWPMFQRAYYTAESLGIAAAVHDQMFVSVWETREFPLLDRATGAIRKPLPTLQDAATFYARYTTVKPAEFLKLAQSAEINGKVQRAEALIKAYGVGGTPTVVVNGRYVIDGRALTSWQEQRQLVAYLVGLERARLKAAAAARP